MNSIVNSDKISSSFLKLDLGSFINPKPRLTYIIMFRIETGFLKAIMTRDKMENLSTCVCNVLRFKGIDLAFGKF